jgi:hypothetical protein
VIHIAAIPQRFEDAVDEALARFSHRWVKTEGFDTVPCTEPDILTTDGKIVTDLVMKTGP